MTKLLYKRRYFFFSFFLLCSFLFPPLTQDRLSLSLPLTIIVHNLLPNRATPTTQPNLQPLQINHPPLKSRDDQPSFAQIQRRFFSNLLGFYDFGSDPKIFFKNSFRSGNFGLDPEIFKLRPITFHSPPLKSGDVSISSAQIRRHGGGFAISLLSSSLRWHCGGGFCSGLVLVWIGDREFGFLWMCWIFVGFGLCFWF